jgi:hypothetical protein
MSGHRVVRLGLPLALWLAGPAAGAAFASHPRGCGRLAGETVYVSKTAVVRRDSNYEDKDVWRACWKPTGRVRRLAVVGLDERGQSTSFLGGFVQHGAWLGWARYPTATSGGATLRTMNLRAGRRGQRVNGAYAGNGDPGLPAIDGPLPNVDPPYYVVAANGNLAWLVQGRDGAGRPASAIYVADESGGSRRIALARGGSSIQRLGTRGTTLVWRSGGRRHEYSLANRHREPAA